MGINGAEDKGQEDAAAQGKGEIGDGDQLNGLLVAALVQGVDQHGAVGARHDEGEQPQRAADEGAVLLKAEYPAVPDGKEAEHRQDAGGNEKGLAQLFHQGIEDQRVHEGHGAVADGGQVRPAFPDDAVLAEVKLKEHHNGKQQHRGDQQAHAVGKGFVQEGGGSERDQKGQ